MTYQDLQQLETKIKEMNELSNVLFTNIRNTASFLASQAEPEDREGSTELMQAGFRAFETCAWLQISDSIIKLKKENNPMSKVVKN